jgi:hypothetical protein
MKLKRALSLSILIAIPALCSCAATRAFFEGTESQPSQASTLSKIIESVVPAPFGQAGGLLITALGLIVTSTKKKEPVA